MSGAFSIVDAHVHFWNPRRLNYPWLASVPALGRAFLPEEYDQATQRAGIGKMIFVECGCEPAQSGDEVSWVSDLAATETRLAGVVAQASVERGQLVIAELKNLAKNPLVKGVRQNIQGEPDPEFCLRPDFIAGVRALAAFGFTFDVCALDHQLPGVIELVRRCPEVFFVLDHCGKPGIREQRRHPWQENLRELASLPNVACKISGLVTEADPARCGAADLHPWVARALACFGFDRVLFGGDWPVCTLAAPFQNWLAALQEMITGASESDRAKLFKMNAEKIYRV